MFKELYELSQKVNTTLPSVGYGFVVGHIEIHVGSPFSILPIRKIDGKGQESLGQGLISPDIIRSSNAADRPLPINDTGQFLFGIGKNGSKYQSNYLALLKECIDRTKDDLVAEVLRVLELLSVDKVRADCSPWFDLKNNKVPLEKARFIFLHDGEVITNRSSVKEFWANKFIEINLSDSKEKNTKSQKKHKSTEKKLTTEGECCITGQKKLLVGSTLPVMVKGVPGSQSKGAALISFNINSVESRKWKKSEHAPLGFDVAERSHQMLNKLLREDRHHYRQGETAFVYWGEYDTGLNHDIWDDPEELWDDDGANVAQMIFTTPDNPQGFSSDDNLNSTEFYWSVLIWQIYLLRWAITSRSYSLIRYVFSKMVCSKFYLAVLTGCDGRIAISRWDETTYQKIQENVTRYIANQKSIPGYKARSLWQLAGSCFRDPSKEQIDPVVKALMLNALWSTAIPRSIVVKVLERIYLDLFSGGNDNKYYSRYYSRFQILALYANNMTEQKSPEIVRKLKIARQLGAIAYLMHDVEITARNLDDPGKTGVASSLRALASTPVQVFGRLYHNTILYHLPTPCNDGDPKKQESRRRHLKRAGKLLKEEFSKLVEMGLSPETDLPTTFSLDENAWFHLGWAMREATFWDGLEKNKTDKKTANQEEE